MELNLTVTKADREAAREWLPGDANNTEMARLTLRFASHRVAAERAALERAAQDDFCGEAACEIIDLVVDLINDREPYEEVKTIIRKVVSGELQYNLRRLTNAAQKVIEWEKEYRTINHLGSKSPRVFKELATALIPAVPDPQTGEKE